MMPFGAKKAHQIPESLNIHFLKFRIFSLPGLLKNDQILTGTEAVGPQK
jgi:hypothetical protein